MATRTEPIALAPSLIRIRFRPLGGLSLCSDQLIQPTHLALDRFQTVTLQLQRVAVQALSCAGQGRTHAVEPLFQPAAAAFEDAQPHLGLGVPEEGEMDAEAFVLPSGRPG